MVKEIIFDFDGTIADTFDLSVQIFNQIKDEYGYKEINPRIVDIFRNEGFGEAIKEIEMPVLKIPTIIRRVQKEMGLKIKKAKLFKGVIEVLEELKNKEINLGILTTNSQANVKKFLEKNKVEYFDYINNGVDLFGKDKILKDIIKKRKLKKEEVVYVGDEIRDVEACKKAGVKIISVTWGFNSKKALEKVKPDWVVDRPEELIKILN